MKKLILIFGLMPFFVNAQIINDWFDSTAFHAGVGFEGRIRIFPNAGNGKVLTSNANGVATWQTPSVGSGNNANNGCTLYGDSVGLGGALSSETTIDANGNILFIGDVVTNTGLDIEPPYAGIFAENSAFIEAVKIRNSCDTFKIDTKKASINSDSSFFVSSKVINFSNTDNLYAQTNTDSGFNTSLFLSPKNTTWSLNEDTLAAGMSNIKSTDGSSFFTNMYVGKNELSSSPGDKMRVSCSYSNNNRLSHVEAAYIDRNFNGPSTLNHISAFQSGLYMAFDSENSDDLGATGFAYLIDSTYRARWLWRGQEIASVDTNGYIISSNILTASATLNFGSIGPHSSETLTISCTGAVLGDVVSLGIPNASMETNASFVAWVSASNTVSVKCFNFNGSSFDPASGTFTVKIIK